MRQEDKTIQSIFNMWFWNFQNNSPQQFSNLYHLTVALITFFNDKAEEENDKRHIYDSLLFELEKMFFYPIEEIKKKYPKLKVSEHVVDWNITNLELPYYRDSRSTLTKLSSRYNEDSFTPRQQKQIKFSELITVLSLFKAELFKGMMRILSDNKILLNIPYQANYPKELEQLPTEFDKKT